MDRRRAAGALLALAACFACSAAAPTASNQTALDLYEGAPEGCYYNFQHYGEGDRIMTNEPCLNCTCHNRMLMCYLRVCPFTKAIGQDCTVEKRADQCCPIVTCPDVPVDLLTSTSTTSPAEYGQTGIGKLDKYGCSISGKYFPEGSKVPPTPNKPCEHCYCIRNMTTCVMQECTLHVDGCTPIYHKDVCCPVRYSCDHPEDEVPLLDDMSTTVRPTPGFLLTTTTVSPVTQMTQDCVHDDQVFADGALIKTEKACEHCYCMKGDIVCVVQECGAPMENEGKNCTSLPPREGQCCPDTYICEGDEISSDLPTESTTETLIEKLTTLSPPRRAGVEGSGYRNEPDEATYTEMPTVESELEGSGDEQETSTPLESDKDIIVPEDGDQYISTKAPSSEEHEPAVTEISTNDIPDEYEKDKTTKAPIQETEKLTTSGTDEENLMPDKHVPATSKPQYNEVGTTESGELLNTVPDVIIEEETIKPHDVPSTTSVPTLEEGESQTSIDDKDVEITPSEIEHEITTSVHPETSKPEYSTSSYSSADETTTKVITEQDFKDDVDVTRTTSIVTSDESTSQAPQTYDEEKEHSVPEEHVPSSTTHPVEGEKLTTEPDHAQNTVAITDEESTHPYLHIQTTTIGSVEDEKTTISNLDIVTAKDNVLSPHEYASTLSPVSEESELTTAEPDKGLNTIPSDINKESSTKSPLPEKEETKATDSSVVTDHIQAADIKPTISSETETVQPERVTKGDQFTITTEPSFRKEDVSGVPTEKPKESEITTVKSELVDEGFIPTSEHDEKYGTSSDIPSTEEESATLIPDYTKEIEETMGSKQTTESSLTESLPSESSKPIIDKEELPGSTEKTVDITTVIPEDTYTHEEPSRIPGEGDCLLNGVTYKNNTIVPSSNNCHTGCRCASSIIKCDPIICSPPPDYMDNCQSIYDSPDSCCPTFVCDHPRETVPPQSDNQMSGTESPMAKPTIECRGDQCEISEPAKQPTQPSELCTSSGCSSDDYQKPASDCGPKGCDDISQKPDTSLPSVEKTECTEGKCIPESCTNDECQVSPVIPCEGEECKEVSGAVSPPSPQSCENEEDCKIEKIPASQTTPCEGESCKKIDCGPGDCDSHVVSTPQDTEQVPCNEQDGCKPEQIPVYDCKGDEPCRRKESSPSEEKPPSECEGPNCIHEKETTVTPDVSYSTKEQITSIPPTIPEKATELPENYITTPENTETEEKDAYTTEALIDLRAPEEPILEEAGTEKPYLIDEEDKKIPSTEEERTEKTVVSEKEDEDKPIVQGETTEKAATVDYDQTGKPALTDEDEKDKPVTVEKETESAAVTDQERTENPVTDSKESTEKPVTDKTEGTETSVLIDEGKPVVTKEEGTEKPDAIDENEKDKPTAIGTEQPAIGQEEHTVKPSVTDEEEETQKPSLIDEDIKAKPTVVAEDSTDKPTETVEEDQEKPTVIAEMITKKPTLIDEQDESKPTVIAEKSTDKPVVDDEGTEEPTIVDKEDKEKPDIVDTDEPITEEYETKKPVIIDEEDNENIIKEEGSGKPVVIENEMTVKPTVTDEEGTESPSIITKYDEAKPTTAQEGAEKPSIDEEGTEKPGIMDEKGSEKPAVDDYEKETAGVKEGDTDKPEVIEDQHKDKPMVLGEKDTEKPTPVVKDENEISVEEKDTETPVVEEDGKEKPVTDDEHKEKPTVTEEKEKPETTDESYTEKISPADEEGKEKPIVDEDKTTETSTVVDEIGTEPSYIEEKEKPIMATEDSKKEPTEEEDKEKPVLIERDGTEQPEIVTLGTVKPELIDEEDKEKLAAGDEISSEKPVILEHTEEPSITDEEGEKEEEEKEKKPLESHEEITIKPAMVSEEDQAPSSEKPTIIDEEDSMKPTLDEKGSTEEPSTDDEKLAAEEGSTKKPFGFDEEGTEKPVEVKEEESSDKPTIIDEELTEKPTMTDHEGTKTPQIDVEEGSGTEIPEENITDTGKESTKAETPVQPTEATETKKPVYESPTTSAEDVHMFSTETNLVDIDDVNTSPQQISPSETPEIKVTESQDSDIKVPVILDHSPTSDIVTEDTTTTEPEQEKQKATTSPVTTDNIQVTSPKIDTKEESSTAGQDIGIDKEVLSTKEPEMHKITDTGDIVTKAPEFEPISEQEILTDTTQLDSLTTKIPDIDEAEKESTTKVEEKPKAPSESHVTESSKDKTVIPGYESTSALPEPAVTLEQVFETTDGDTQKTESPEEHSTEPEKVDSQLPDGEETKIDHPEVPDKTEVITETPVYSITEPVRSFTEIEDSYVTGQDDVFTGYPEKSTEYSIDQATESSEKPMLTDIESPELPEKTPETDLQEQSTRTPEAEKEKPTYESHATDEPIDVEIKTDKIPFAPEKDVTSHEEKTTRIPDLSEQTHEDTTKTDDYTRRQDTSTNPPESHVTEKHISEEQETSTKSEQPEITGTQTFTTDLPKTTIREKEIGTIAPEVMHTDSHDQDISTPVEDVRTEEPDLQITSEIPQSLITERQEDHVETTISDIKKEESLETTQFQESTKVPELHIHEHDIPTESPAHITESVERETGPEITEQEVKTTKLSEEAVTEKLHTEPHKEVTEKSEVYPQESEDTTEKQIEEDTKSSEQTSAQIEFSETTPYWIELDEHTHKIVEDISTDSPIEEEHTLKVVEYTSTTSPSEEEHTHKIVEDISNVLRDKESSTMHPEAGQEPQISEVTTKKTDDEEIETSTKEVESASKPSEESLPENVSEKVSEPSVGVQDTTPVASQEVDNKYTTDQKEYATATSTQLPEQFTPAVITDSEKSPISESDNAIPTAPETSATDKPPHSIASHETTIPEDELIYSTTKATTLKQDEELATLNPDDKFSKPEEKPIETTEVSPVSSTSEVSKPSVADMQPTDEIPAPEEEHFGPTGTSGYGEPDYVEEDQAFGPGTCRYGGKVYVSAQQIPRDDPCDFCFCFRSDIICLQQSCPPPIHGCHEEPIQGFCCPRYECPVSMATTVNVTTTTTTTTTTLPPHFPTHSYKGAAQRRGCQIKGHTYKVGEVVRSSSGPCLHCTCGGDGQMKCDPKACTPEPMLRQMIAAAVSAKRRR